MSYIACNLEFTNLYKTHIFGETSAVLFPDVVYFTFHEALG